MKKLLEENIGKGVNLVMIGSHNTEGGIILKIVDDSWVVLNTQQSKTHCYQISQIKSLWFDEEGARRVMWHY